VRPALRLDLVRLSAAPEAGRVRALPSPAGLDDATLVDRALRGDGWAEEMIYRRHVGYVFALAGRLLRNSVEAEDVVQDTFTIALDRIGSLRDGVVLRAWLAQIAVSQVRRRFRRKKLLRLLHLETSVDDSTLEALAGGLGTETRAELALLDRVLATLPSEYRLAWMLRHVEGESLEDIATIAGCSLATAKRRIAAAEARVRMHVSLGEASL
jgi:RNA polymerase sigma-70 factor (ECF subfamily)